MKILILALSLTLFACVSKSKYEDMETNYQTSLSEEQAKVADLQAKIGELETLIAQLERRLGTASEDKEALKVSITQMKTALSEMTARKQEADARIREYQDLVKRFKKLTASGQLSVKIVDGRMVVGLPSDVLFSSGSANLSQEGESTVKQVATLLTEIPDREYQVEGHTDNVPIRTAQFPSNWELASARGLNVVKMMIEAGLPESRVSAASFGEHKPIADNSTEEGKRANRRIEIVIVPDLSTLPGYEELEKLGGGDGSAESN